MLCVLIQSRTRVSSCQAHILHNPRPSDPPPPPLSPSYTSLYSPCGFVLVSGMFFFFFFFFQRAALQTALEPRVTLICMCGCWMASITPTTCSRPIPATSDLLHFTYRPEPAALCVPADSPPCVYEHGLKCVVHVNIWSCLLPSEEHAASCLMISLQADSSVSERSRGGGERMLSLHCNHKMNLLFCLRSIIGQKGFMNPFLLMWNLH